MHSTIEINSRSHCTFLLYVHLVFVTKYRKTIFTIEHLNYMNSIFCHVCNTLDAKLVEFNGESDHVHLLVSYPPKIAISKLVAHLKGISSRQLRQSFQDIQQHYWKGRLWSPSYFASSCGGAPINTIKQYIQNQNTPT